MLTTVVSGRTYDFSHTVGALGYMQSPVAVECGTGDSVYVLSRQYEVAKEGPWNKTALWAQINKLSIGNEWGTEEHLGKIGRYGNGEGELIWPAGFVLNGNGSVFVTDEWMNRISRFTVDGEFEFTWGTEGEGDGEFNRPSGITIDSNGDLLVVDSLNHRIQKFGPDGVFKMKFGSLGSAPGELDSPWGITVDSQDNIYVADHKNHRVQKFDSSGNLLGSFGSYGSGGKGQLNRPSDVAVDPDGDVYVCDWANNRVQIFGENGKFITSLLGDAHELSKWQKQVVDSNRDVVKARRRVSTMEPEWRFSLPAGLTFDKNKFRLIVADSQRGRVQIYNKVKDYMEPQFNL